MEVFKCGCLDLTGVLCTGAAGLGGQAGVAWPAGVDPNRREAYLSKQEFVQVISDTWPCIFHAGIHRNPRS